MYATLDSLESWLIAIAQHTRETKEALQGRAGAVSPGGAGPGKADDSMLDKLGQRIEAAMKGGLTSGLNQAKSLAARGFAGTTEAAQNSYAMEMLGKQFAAVMKPVMDAMTYGAVQIEQRMRGMNGSQQNAMLGGILGAGIGMRYGGVGGALAGGAIGALALGAESSVAGGAAGAYLGFRAGGPIGALAGYAVGSVAGSGDYGRLRREGNSRFASGFGSGVGSLTDLGYNTLGKGGLGIIGGANPMDAIRAEADKKAAAGGKKPEERRDVTPFQAEMMEAGGTAARVQESLIRATAGAGFEDAGPLKPLVDIGLAILDQLIKMSGGTPPPRSARADG